MSDNDNKQDNSTPEDTSQKSCHKGSCCKPHASIYISIAALALAGYAAFNVNNTHDNSGLTAQVTSLDNRVSNINNQLEALSSEMQSNRDNLVQNKLKKALESIRDISDIAEEGTKATIFEVEKMLQTLTGISDNLSLPSLGSLKSQAQPESTDPVQPETTTETKPEVVQPAKPSPESSVTITPAPNAAPDATTSAIQPEPKTEPETHSAAPQAF